MLFAAVDMNHGDEEDDNDDEHEHEHDDDVEWDDCAEGTGNDALPFHSSSCSWLRKDRTIRLVKCSFCLADKEKRILYR